MAITAQDVNKLRQMTGAGMMDCKKALQESNGDFDAAIEYLRKKGQKVAAKRADRETTEGYVFTKTNSDNTAVFLLALGCETDFVAKNDDFQKLGSDLIELAASKNISSKDALMAAEFQGNTVENILTDYIVKIGEKIEITDFEIAQGEAVESYVHSNGKVGVVIAFTGANGADVSEVGKDISMQIAAMNPVALDENGVHEDIKEREMEIGRDQARQEGKPENILDKIAEGKLKRFYKDNTLLHQSFVKDPSMTVKQVLENAQKGLTIKEYKRVALG